MAERKIEIEIVGDVAPLKKDVKRGVDEASKEINRLQMQAIRAQRNAARTATAASLAGIASTGGGFYLRNRAAQAGAGTAGRGAAAAVSGALAKTAARYAVGAVLGGVAGVAIVAGASSLLGRRKQRSGSKNPAQDTNQILLDILAQSSRQSKSLNQIAVEAQARLDPLGRGPAFQRSRMAALNANIRPGAANLEFRQAEAQRDLALVNAALIRRRQEGASAELGILATEASTMRNRVALTRRDAERNLTSHISGILTSAILPGSLSRQIGGTSAQSRGILGFGPNEIVPAGGGAGEAFRSIFTGSFFDPASERGTLPGGVARRNAVQAMGRRRQLMALQIRGPGNVLAPAPTIRAGEESEYRFRVAQQRRGMQSEAGVEYLKSIRDILAAMRRKGEATDEQMEAIEVRQNVGKYIQGVN